MNPQDFATGQDVIRALQSAHCALGGVLRNLAEHPERLTDAGGYHLTDLEKELKETKQLLAYKNDTANTFMRQVHNEQARRAAAEQRERVLRGALESLFMSAMANQ